MSDKQRRPLRAPGEGRSGDAGAVGVVAEKGLAPDPLDQVLSEPDRLAGVLADSADVPGQDIIYEQLARLGAYDQLDPARLEEWGYRVGPVVDRPDNGLHARVFLPIAGAAAPTTPLGHMMLELHGAPLRPVLAFRGGTRRQGPIDDFDAQGISSFQFTANEALIVSALRGARSRVDVVGHGLGGCLAQLAASRYPQAIGRVVTFQTPPVDEQDAGQLATFNDKVPGHQRVASTHHRVGPAEEVQASEARTSGKLMTWTLASLDDPGVSMPLSQLDAARGHPVPGVVGIDGQPVQERLLAVQRTRIGRTGPELGAARLKQAVADGLDRRDPSHRQGSTDERVAQVRVRVVEMATSSSFHFRQIVAFVDSQHGLSAEQKVSLQEEARQVYRDGR